VQGPGVGRKAAAERNPAQFRQSKTQPIKRDIPDAHTRGVVTRAARRIERTHELKPITARALAERGFRAGKRLEEFLQPDLEKELGDVARS
jgi:hypothetical protein